MAEPFRIVIRRRPGETVRRVGVAPTPWVSFSRGIGGPREDILEIDCEALGAYAQSYLAFCIGTDLEVELFTRYMHYKTRNARIHRMDMYTGDKPKTRVVIIAPTWSVKTISGVWSARNA